MSFTQYIPDYTNRPEWNPASAQQPPAPAPSPTGGFGMVGGAPAAPAPAPAGIISGAMAPVAPPPAPAPFGMGGGTPTLAAAPTAPGGLQAFYDANKTNPMAVAQFMKNGGYTTQKAAQELGIDEGYVTGWFASAGVAPDQYQVAAAPAGFGMVGGPVPAGIISSATNSGPVAPPAPAVPVAPVAPVATGGLQSVYDSNKSNPVAVAQYMKANGYTAQQAATELGIDVGYITGWFNQAGIAPDQYQGANTPPAGSPIAGVGSPPAGSPPGGIVSSQFSRTALGPQTNWDVTSQQTVEGRVNALTNPNNPLIQQARANALQTANERGLANSSLAMTAADAAAYQVALPIAQADAATYAKSAGYNADQANQRSLAETTMANQFTTAQMGNANAMDQARLSAETSRVNAQLSADTSLGTARIGAQNNLDQARLQGENQAAIARINTASQQLLSQMDITAKAGLQEVVNKNNVLIQTNSQAAGAFNTAAQAVDNIQRSTTMDGTAKTRAIATVSYNLQGQLQMLAATSGLNLGQQLMFAGQPGFDNQGRWVGFAGDTATTAAPAAPGSPPAPPPAPAQPTPPPAYEYTPP